MAHLSKRKRDDQTGPRPGGEETNNLPFLTSSDTIRFILQETSFRQIFEVPEYRFDDLTPHDRVIDIGANVGAFCIRASCYSSNVVAVEPVTAALLRKNIRLNDVPVRVIEAALGDGREIKVSWDDREVTSPSFPLTTIIDMAGGCDFLKCDCEGAEWLINPPDLAGIRRIEMELHTPPISGPPNSLLLDYIDQYYHFTLDRKPVHSALGVMGVLHAERK
ncbi:MAG TPA: FkbM family methyltransferase [Methanoregula sp.]|nr:FkbM family methyltransferase [Methanoregula sp.]